MLESESTMSSYKFGNPEFASLLNSGCEVQDDVEKILDPEIDLGLKTDIGGLTVEAESDDVLEDCGMCGWSLKWLNRFRTPKWCLVFLTWASLTHGKSEIIL